MPAVLAAIVAALQAIPALAKIGVVWMTLKVRADIRRNEDEMVKISVNASPVDQLRIETLKRRAGEDSELLGALRSAVSHLG